MIQGKLTYDRLLLPYFSKVNWKQINTRSHHQYEQSIRIFYEMKHLSEEEIIRIQKDIEQIQGQLAQLDETIKGNRIKLIS